MLGEYHKMFNGHFHVHLSWIVNELLYRLAFIYLSHN